MCGIAGALSQIAERIPNLERRLRTMNTLQSHRGPDGQGLWQHVRQHVGRLILVSRLL